MKLKITFIILLYTSLTFSQSTTLIPDSNFEQSLINLGIDSNGLTGDILNSDAESITFLSLLNVDISDLTGINSFTNLIYLNISNNSDSAVDFVIGTVAYNPSDDTKLIFNLDTATLPSNTLLAVDKIIDARANYPGDGTLDVAATDQRYLLTEDIDATGHLNWGVDAKADDIIQYNGSAWLVVFKASAVVSTQYATNTFTSTQYRWTGKAWISSYEGEYNPAFWRLAL